MTTSRIDALLRDATDEFLDERAPWQLGPWLLLSRFRSESGLDDGAFALFVLRFFEAMEARTRAVIEETPRLGPRVVHGTCGDLHEAAESHAASYLLEDSDRARETGPMPYLRRTIEELGAGADGARDVARFTDHFRRALESALESLDRRNLATITETARWRGDVAGPALGHVEEPPSETRQLIAPKA